MNECRGETNVIQLPSGRQLGYSDLGAIGGRPVLYCHGLPGSRREPHLFQAASTRRGLRIIGLDRPGYGSTSLLPGRVVGDEVTDVVSLIDRLELDRFDVIGFSGGGPPALACAARLPDRIGRVSLVGSWAPFAKVGLAGMHDDFRQLWELARQDFASFSQTLRGALDQAGGPYELLLGGAPDQDRAILELPEIVEIYRRDLDEALRQADAGMLEDAAAVVSAWAFPCSAVKCPVRLFHGEQDGNAPLAMARWLEEHLPDAHLDVWRGAAHFEAFRRWDEILAVHSDH